MDGIINLYKPAGISSFQCVAAVKRILKTKKVGHAGTLDPEATGVLPICVGKATKLAELFLCCPKSYRGKVLFGVSTNTQDVWGQTLATADVSGLTEEALLEASEKFKGDIEQIPPAFSAIKVNGQPLYKKARAGETVEVPVRKVHIYDFKVSFFMGTDLELYREKYGVYVKEAVVETTCSRGTYVRTLCYDLGRTLGIPSCMSELCRTSYGPLSLETAVSLEQLETDSEKYILPMEYILHNFPVIEATDVQIRRFINGQKTTVTETQFTWPEKSYLYPTTEEKRACLKHKGNLIAIVGTDLDGDGRILVKPWKFLGGPEVNADN